MNATKILWGQVLAVNAVALAFVWAWRLAFQAQFGHPWFEILGLPEPLGLGGGLAGLATFGFCAVALRVSTIRAGNEELSTMEALTR